MYTSDVVTELLCNGVTLGNIMLSVSTQVMM